MLDSLHAEKFLVFLIGVHLFTISVFPQPSVGDNLWPMWLHDSQRTGRSSLAGPGRASEIEVVPLIQGQQNDLMESPVIDSEGILYLPARINGLQGIWAFYPDGSLKWYYPAPVFFSPGVVTVLNNRYILDIY